MTVWVSLMPATCWAYLTGDVSRRSKTSPSSDEGSQYQLVILEESYSYTKDSIWYYISIRRSSEYMVLTDVVWYNGDDVHARARINVTFGSRILSWTGEWFHQLSQSKMKIDTVSRLASFILCYTWDNSNTGECWEYLNRATWMNPSKKNHFLSMPKVGLSPKRHSIREKAREWKSTTYGNNSRNTKAVGQLVSDRSPLVIPEFV